MEVQLLFDFAKKELYNLYLKTGVHSDFGLSPEESNSYGCRLSILLQHARFSNAHALINEVEEKMLKEAPLQHSGSVLDEAIVNSGLDLNYVNRLEEYGFIIWRDVANYKPGWFIENIHQFGEGGAVALQEAFRKVIDEWKSIKPRGV